MRIIATQVDADAVGNVHAQPRAAADLALAVALGAVGPRRDAVAAEISGGQRARERAAPARPRDVGAAADRKRVREGRKGSVRLYHGWALTFHNKQQYTLVQTDV